jgi:hypothetical protein
LAGTIENLQKSSGRMDSSSKEKKEAHKLELSQTQEMLKEAWNTQDEAGAKMYKLLRNLLSSDLQSQWDWVCCKILKRDLWARVIEQMTIGRHPHLWTCLELHKLTVFTADVVVKQRVYIEQAVCKPQKATVHQHILRMECSITSRHYKTVPRLSQEQRKGTSSLSRLI